MGNTGCTEWVTKRRKEEDEEKKEEEMKLGRRYGETQEELDGGMGVGE